jgi:hypothetical protein
LYVTPLALSADDGGVLGDGVLFSVAADADIALVNLNCPGIAVSAAIHPSTVTSCPFVACELGDVVGVCAATTVNTDRVTKHAVESTCLIDRSFSQPIHVNSSESRN